jgi:hypothetical protein
MSDNTMHGHNMVRDAWPEESAQRKDRDENSFESSLFAFSRRDGCIDWRLLSSVDPDTVARRGDISALQTVIDNLTFADMEKEGAWVSADRNLVKLLRLAQLCIEYLVHTQVRILSASRTHGIRAG